MSENFSRLTVVRHGQSTWNKLQKVQGQNDEAQLTAEGRAMARAVATDLAPHSFSRIISSDLQRIPEKEDNYRYMVCLSLTSRQYSY